jgi:DhnA family fructose-bisphosphate aldolase class Ia
VPSRKINVAFDGAAGASAFDGAADATALQFTPPISRLAEAPAGRRRRTTFTRGAFSMEKYRLRRLFNSASGRCLDVAIDHGFFNELSFLGGIEDIARSVGTLVAAKPDAIQLTVGQAGVLQSLPGKEKPSLVLRTDVANVYGASLPRELFSRMIEHPVEQALRLDAVCVVVNLFRIPDQPGVTDQCIRNILKLKPQCDVYGMPLMIEPLVFRPNEKAGGYMVDGDPAKIIPLVRQATELGADVIKADPTDDVAVYHRVVETARVPVLVRGGGKADDADVLKRTEALIRQGAAGIVYGRNIIQHADPGGMTRALMAIVHEGATAAQAGALIRGKS